MYLMTYEWPVGLLIFLLMHALPLGCWSYDKRNADNAIQSFQLCAFGAFFFVLTAFGLIRWRGPDMPLMYEIPVGPWVKWYLVSFILLTIGGIVYSCFGPRLNSQT